MIGYTAGNLVLRRRASGAVKRDFRPCIGRYTSPNENFEYGYPHSNALLQFRLKLECKAARHPTRCDVINCQSILQDILSQFFDVLSDVALKNQVC